MVNQLVVKDPVRGEDKTVTNRSHNLLDTTLIERENTVENGDLVITERLLALTVELEEALELGLLVATRQFRS